MEWRIILPVVCVLGILFVPGSIAQDPSASTKGTATNVKGTNATATNAAATNATSTNVIATNATANNATNTNATVTNATVTNATATNATATNATVTNATATNATATNATTTNATATNATVTNATATNATATNATATNATATNATLTNASVTNAIATNATATNATVTNATVTNAITTNATANNATATNATVTNAITTNATANNATATNATVTNAITTNATANNATATNATATNATATNASVTNATATNATATNASVTNATGVNATATTATATNATATNATATNSTSANSTGTGVTTTNATNSAVTKLNITYSIDLPFKNEYNDLNQPETISLINNLTSQIESLYKKRFTNFRRYIIRKFRNGSIVTEGALEFSDNGTVPKAQDVVNVLVEAAKGGNFTFPVQLKSVTAPDSSVVPATPLFNTSQINVTFSLTDTFTEALSNMSSPEAKNLTDKITTQFLAVFKGRYANILRMVIRKFSKGSIITEGALEFSDLETVPKAQDVVKVIIDAAKAGNFTLSIDKKTVSASDSSGVPATPLFNTSQINVTFSITDTFTEALSNMSSPEAKNLTDKITTQFLAVFKGRYANILRMVIRKFSKGSIITEGALEFSDLETVPKAQDVVKVIIDAAKANSFNLSIDKKTVSASDSSGVPATPLFNTSQINVTFSITDTFTEALSNMSSPEAKNLTDKITTQFLAVFKGRYANILRMVIRKFSKGSIITEGALEFSDLETVPKAQDVVNVIIDAAKANSFNLSIDKQTVSATDSSGNSATPLFNTSQINVTFSIIDTFTEALSNMSSPEAKNLTDKITTQFFTVFKRGYANILRMVIRKFSKGSIITDGKLEFSDLDTVPKAQEVVNFIVKEVKAGNFNFPVDVKSITATDSSGFATSHGSSTVISSMFTVLCMALASLLLSGVMHQ